MTRANLPAIDADRLLNQIKELGRIGALPGGGVCRLALSEEDKAGRDWLVARMREQGLEVFIDRIGNIFGVRAGRRPGPPVMVGSHIDTVSTGGIYDGCLGVLAGLEIAAALDDAGIETERPLAVAAFTNEEGARFAPDMMGSLAFVDAKAREEALAAADTAGETVADCLERIGYAGADAPFADGVHAYVELHIEQGPILEAEGVDVGVVEGVQGISWTEIVLHGVSAHAGGTPMRLRSDAGYVASEISAGVRRIAKEIGGDQLGTVGAFEVKPNLVNVVPNWVRMTVDLRNPDEERLKAAEARLSALVKSSARAEGVSAETRALARFEATAFDPEMVNLFERQASRRGLSTRRMFSGAGHDAQIMARICPSAMIFIPSVGGISHNIKEFSKAEDIANGAGVLFAVVADLIGIDPASHQGAARN